MKGVLSSSPHMDMPCLHSPPHSKYITQSIFVGAECTLLYIYTSSGWPLLALTSIMGEFWKFYFFFFFYRLVLLWAFLMLTLSFFSLSLSSTPQPLSSSLLEYYLTIYIHITLFNRPLLTVQSYTVFEFYIYFRNILFN